MFCRAVKGGFWRDPGMNRQVLCSDRNTTMFMKKAALGCYVTGTVIIIKSLFRYGIFDGAEGIAIGFLFLVAGYYISKYLAPY